MLLATIFLMLLPQWTVQTSGTTARLRGMSAVSSDVAWASGSESTVLRTVNGGTSWEKLHVTDDKLDFRDIDAIDASTAYVLSIGNGSTSRIYKTSDGGKSWKLQFLNTDPKAFFDSISFWDAKNGILMGDSIEGRFFIMMTNDGGLNWKPITANSLPTALENEGAFAASGTNIALFRDHAWIATGGAAKSRVLHSADRGRTWNVVDTPLLAGPSAGIFSIAFRDEMHGVIVGGDYKKESESIDNVALTSDGGRTWQLSHGLSGYRSLVAYVNNRTSLFAVGPNGADYSLDDGQTWTRLDGPGFDTLSFARTAPPKNAVIGWAGGDHGRIARLNFPLK